MSLEEIRETIDGIDAEIVRLLDKRAGYGRDAAEMKRKLGLPLHNPIREREIVERLAAISNGSMPRRALENIYRLIMTETLSQETTDRNGCSGHAVPGDKRDLTAEIVENTLQAPGFHRMRLKVPELAETFAPGQFFQLLLRDGHFFLRRPFAPSETTAEGFAFVYAVVGEGTRRLARLTPGATVGILAPLGNAYTLLPAGAGALLIGGGCGAPSLAPLARRLLGEGVRVTTLIGARTSTALLEQETFANTTDHLIIATDDGSQGCKGTVIDACRMDEIAAQSRPDRIYACGPVPMLRAAAALAEELGVDCEVSLEERMACGFGACMGCAVPVLSDSAAAGTVYRRVCHEGPVFNSRTLAWREMGVR